MMERRFLDAAELRMDEAEGSAKITGYAAVFNSMSEDLGGFREVIAPGAFSDVLGDDVRALWNHDANHVLGRSKSGTLQMEQDARGLRVSIEPPESAIALLESMRRGDVDQMSFAFRVLDDDWRMDGETVIRTVKKIGRLYDVSVVTYPAYPEASAALRSLEEFRQTVEAVPEYGLVKARLRLASV